MKRIPLRTLWLALVAALFSGSCADGPTAPRPEPGSLIVSFTTPNVDDRAAMFTVVLPPGTTTGSPVLSASGLEVFHRRVADTLRVAVFGAIPSGELLRIAVPDLRQVPRMTVSLLEVAAENDALRESFSGYTIRVSRP